MPKNRFLAVFFGPVHSIGLLGQPKTGCGCRSIQKKQKKTDRTGPLNTKGPKKYKFARSLAEIKKIVILSFPP